VPELDEHLVLAELLARPPEVVERRVLVDDVGRQLEEDPAELAGLAQRLERAEELAEDHGSELARRPVDAAALVDGHSLAQLGRQLLEPHRMARHQPERLHVHDEAVGRPVGPALHRRALRQPVVGGIDLDGREALGVPGKPLLRRQLGRIEPLRERLVGPRARPDPDRRRHAADASERRLVGERRGST
jgi:hypothetical protein